MNVPWSNRFLIAFLVVVAGARFAAAAVDIEPITGGFFIRLQVESSPGLRATNGSLFVPTGEMARDLVFQVEQGGPGPGALEARRIPPLHVLAIHHALVQALSDPRALASIQGHLRAGAGYEGREAAEKLGIAAATQDEKSREKLKSYSLALEKLLAASYVGDGEASRRFYDGLAAKAGESSVVHAGAETEAASEAPPPPRFRDQLAALLKLEKENPAAAAISARAILRDRKAHRGLQDESVALLSRQGDMASLIDALKFHGGSADRGVSQTLNWTARWDIARTLWARADSLGPLKGAARAALKLSLNDPEWNVREAVEWALRRLDS